MSMSRQMPMYACSDSAANNILIYTRFFLPSLRFLSLTSDDQITKQQDDEYCPKLSPVKYSTSPAITSLTLVSISFQYTVLTSCVKERFRASGLSIY